MPGAGQAHVAHRLSPWPMVLCLCGLCFPPWDGLDFPRPLLRDSLEHRGPADRGARTASHPDTVTLPGLISCRGVLCQSVGGRGTT